MKKHGQPWFTSQFCGAFSVKWPKHTHPDPKIVKGIGDTMYRNRINRR